MTIVPFCVRCKLKIRVGEDWHEETANSDVVFIRHTKEETCTDRLDLKAAYLRTRLRSVEHTRATFHATGLGTTTIDLTRIREQWDDLIRLLRHFEPMLAVCVSAATPKGLHGEVLTLSFQPSHSFHAEVLRLRESQTSLEEYLELWFEKRFTVAIEEEHP